MRNGLTGRLYLLLLTFAAMLILPSMALATEVAPDGTTSASAPTIQSDKDDYPPGGAVTLTGSGWQPGESVHINVNDDQTKSWERNVDVVADENGNITDQFNLPDRSSCTGNGCRWSLLWGGEHLRNPLVFCPVP